MTIQPTARDGRRARLSGPWTQEKLSYLRKYASAFMTAMTPKRTAGIWECLEFIDLLAGPGVCIDRVTGVEFPGSPLLALATQPAFDRLYFADLSSRNVAALKARIAEADSGRVQLERGDCNTLARTVVDALSRKTLALAFVDPEGFEATFAMFQAFAGRAIDIVFLFPSGIGVKRNLQAFARQTDSPMDALWGNRTWRRTPIARLLAGETLTPQEAEQLDYSWVLAFRQRVATLGYIHHDSVGPLRNDRNVPMYHLLFFSKHLAGLKIWRGITRIEASGQRTLRYEE